MAKDITKINQKVYKKIIEDANCSILKIDSKGNIKFLNKFAQNLFGFSEKEIIGCNVRGAITLKEDARFLTNIRKILKLFLNTLISNSFEYENIDRIGNKLWIVWSCSGIYGKEKGLDEIICIGINITELKRHDELIFSKEKEKASIAERARLARDLHDTVSQTIFSASLIADVLPRLWDKDNIEGRKRLEELRKLTRAALTEMRMLLLELRPSTFAEEDLRSLVRQLSKSISVRTGIPIKVKVEGKYALPFVARLALYRIAQEALNNVAKHSSATKVYVKLKYYPDKLYLSIDDNGCGFDRSSLSPDNLGLGIMKERAQSMGASIDIDSVLGKGTKISVTYNRD